MTKRPDGSLALAVWNLVDPDKAGVPRELRLAFKNVAANASVKVSLVDNDHGNTLAAYRALGSPQYPTPDQIREINSATALRPPDRFQLNGTHLDLKLQVNALALIEIQPAP